MPHWLLLWFSFFFLTCVTSVTSFTLKPAIIILLLLLLFASSRMLLCVYMLCASIDTWMRKYETKYLYRNEIAISSENVEALAEIRGNAQKQKALFLGSFQRQSKAITFLSFTRPIFLLLLLLLLSLLPMYSQ